ncbi:MAG: biopolymer transporter ExbD [Deltaproteobacteria bacterium]|nr:biopolymer transporter ExbD [Deltaproteobacteria bacterium]
MAASFRPSNEDSAEDGIVAEINITPLTDVFLVLLVIFMVTSSVVANQSKNIDLPGAEVSDVTPEGVTVTVDDAGLIYVNDDVVSEAELFPKLEAALENTRDKLVILRGDKQVLLGQAVNILDLAQQAGATGIALATKPPAKGAGPAS